jgi:hypothetical protein
MKIVEGIDASAKVEELTEQEKDDFFTSLVMGKDVTEEVDTGRGKFTLRFPKAKDILSIGKITAFRRGYKPAEAFYEQTDMLNIMASTLDVVVVSGPDWFEAAKKANKNFNFMEVPSREFIYELYGKAYSFRGEVEKRLNAREGTGGERIPSAENADAALDGGAFGGLASG